MNILMLSLNTFPYPASRGAAEGRTLNLIKYLHQRQHQVTLVTHRHRAVTDEDVAALKEWVTHLEILPAPTNPEPAANLMGKAAQISRLARFALTATPPSVRHRFSPVVQAWVEQFVAAGKCDVVVCEHSVNEIYIRPEFRQRVRTVVDIHSSVYGWILNHLQMGASENPGRDRFYLPLLARYEKRYCRKFSQLIATTKDDRQQLLDLVPDAEIEIVSNGVDLDTFPYRPGDPGGQRLIFIGAMDSSHNIDGATYFAREVFPLVQQRYPQATLSLVGARPVAEVKALDGLPGVTVTGRVPSITDYLHQSTLCVVPLRVGLGIKTKTLESMASGIPIVASDRGLEGLTVDEVGIPLRALRANTPQAFVDAIGRLFERPELRTELSRNARAMIEADYTWERAGEKYERVLAVPTR
ncbi:MAG: glycosyltransferase family 4 protein [Cyanobacteria bacterium P01_H01_bin.119]